MLGGKRYKIPKYRMLDIFGNPVTQEQIERAREIREQREALELSQKIGYPKVHIRRRIKMNVLKILLGNWKSILSGAVYSYKIQKSIRDNYKNITVEESIELMGAFQELLDKFFQNKDVKEKIESRGDTKIEDIFKGFIFNGVFEAA